MSQGPLCPNLTKKFQKEVSQIANRNLSWVILLGGLSVNLNHLIICMDEAINYLPPYLNYRCLHLHNEKFNVSN